METRSCQNCKKDFLIEKEDFNFYEKIKVPPPTFCAECRIIRRFLWRNERFLHKRKCDAPGHKEELISMYSSGVGCVYDHKFWWGDSWNAMDYGKDYDFSESFFENFKDLMNKVPLPDLSVINSVNSDYSNWTDYNKNCYLAFAAGYNEDTRYINKSMSCRDSQDLLYVGYDELCYELVNCFKCNKLFFGLNCKTCIDSAFLFDCRNCVNCFMCFNLVSKSYCINNKQYSKEEYRNEISKYNLSSHKNVEKLKIEFNKMVNKAIHRYATIIGSNKCTGNDINNSKNIHDSFEIFENVEDSRFLVSCLQSKSIYDCMGSYKVELGYENVDNNEDNNVACSIVTYTSHDVRYCICCHGSSNLFGCIGLRNKEYCILNKQYSKDEYKKITKKIIESMGNKYGEFFPTELSPFCYNETIAQEYFPLTKEEAIDQGYKWKDREERNYEIDIKTEDIPNDIKDVDESIIGKVIECEHKGECNEQCTEAFKIIEQEYQFYKRMNLPIPHLCPNCRHYARLKQRNPLKLWHRQCMKEGCTNEFKTSYAPDRPEIVYCERCYQQEVY